MSQKSSVPQASSFVSQVLKRDIAALRTDAGVTWCQQTSRRRLIPFSSVA